jgi:hypothetical protein
MEKQLFELFKKARKSKRLNSVLTIHSKNESFIRLCIDEKSEFKQSYELVFLEIPCKFVYNSFSSDLKLREIENLERICFYESNYGERNHITTILNSIKENSEISIHVTAFNNCSSDLENGIVRHEAYIKVDKNMFLFSKYVGQNNLASPIKF